MYARIESLGLYGIDGYPVTVEADTSSGLPAFDLVGLPDAAVSESRDRVRSAMRNSGFSFPVSRVTVNLAPADKKKSGPIYDLPILLVILLASGQLEFSAQGAAFIGELALDGQLRPISGALGMALAARDAGIKRLFLPAENAQEAAVAQGLQVFGVRDVAQLICHLRDGAPLGASEPPVFSGLPCQGDLLDFADVRGQYAARRAIEIAAAGGHNLLMIGPAGSGKSMLARRIPSILPPLEYEEAIETTKIYSAAGQLADHGGLVRIRPFRAPHHTVSPAGLTGGGSMPRPGEISLAHNGVLFLDELPEFSRAATEVLRQPLEDGFVTISRAVGSLRYPSTFMLVAAMNPCPCGNFGSTKPCVCAPHTVERYLSRISGPLLDRIDLHVEVAPVDYNSLAASKPGESSAAIRARVLQAREVQRARYAESGIRCNALLPASRLEQVCVMTDSARNALRRAFEGLGLSARAYGKLLKVARTIADLAGAQTIDAPHIAEAVQYRALDKKYWLRG